MGDQTLEKTEDEQTSGDSASGFRPAVSGSTKATQETSGSGASSSSMPSSTQAASKAGSGNEDQRLQDLAKTLDLKMARPSVKVTNFLKQIAELDAKRSRSALENRLLNNLKKSAKAQDKADKEAEEIASLMQDVREAERNKVRSRLLDLGDRVSMAQGVPLADAYELIESAVARLLKV